MIIKKLLLIILTATTVCSSCTKDKIEGAPGSSGTPSSPGSPGTSNQFNVTFSTIAGKYGDHGNAEDGNGASARFWNPTKMVFDNRNNTLYVADGSVVRSIDQQNNVKSYVPLGAIGSSYNEILDIDVAPGAGGTLYIVTKENDLWKIEPDGDLGKATNIINRVYGGNDIGSLNSGDYFDLPKGLATGPNGEVYFLNESWATIHRLTFTSASYDGVVEPFAGKPLPQRGGDGDGWPFVDGQGEAATFSTRSGDIAADGNGNIYVADYDFGLVRKVTPTGTVSSMFKFSTSDGKNVDGPVATAEAWRVTNVTSNKDGSYIFFTSTGLRLLRPGKDVTSLTTDIDFGNEPVGDISGLATTADGKTVYFSEQSNKIIRKVVLQ